MLDSIAASTTYANHLDDGTQRCIVDHIKFHDFTPVRNAVFIWQFSRDATTSN